MYARPKFRNFFKTVFPAGKTEVCIFVFFLLAYGVNAWYIAENFRIVYDDRIPWDAYFSFDNRAIVRTGGGFERHPLSNYFFDLIRSFALSLSCNRYDGVFRVALAMLSTVVISLANVQIYKYLQDIIGLPPKISLLIVAFYGLFVTNILLSFTPETYTYTLLFLSIFNYYASKRIKENRALPLGAATAGTVLIGGLTITNIVKVDIPLLFEKNLLKSWRKIGIVLAKITVSTGVFVLMFLYRLDFNIQNFFNKTGEQYDKFSKPRVTPLWDMIASWFFGGNVLFSSFEVRDYHNKDRTFFYKALFMDVYSSWPSYFFVGILLLLTTCAIAKNFRNRLVWMLVISFSIDISIHCVLRFGLHTSYIYGGHFVFVYPLLLGWLFSSLKDKARLLTVLYGVLIVLTVFLAFNNFYRMAEFYQFLEAYYQ